MADRDSEEVAIRDYFNNGFTYDEIVALLEKYHGVKMSIATLKRRLKEYGLKRTVEACITDRWMEQKGIMAVCNAIKQLAA